ncbi:MAG TPA: CinA family protein [Atopobiaceae bacterium]|mgnify:CR=1 FL=1|nr:CinA family protein [Atopobiaceae bacterium]
MAFPPEIYELAESVLAAARRKGIRLACAESCTGGLVSAALTDVPGSSDVFAGGVVSYALDAKEHVLGIDPALLYAPGIGAVSSACAEAMARNVSELFSADMAVSVTGIAGPGGEEPGKPVGTVWFACKTPAGIESDVACFAGGRAEVREQALLHALALLYGHLVDLCPSA